MSSKYPIDITENGKNRKLGFIYSYDVASVIIHILQSPPLLVSRKSFNISQVIIVRILHQQMHRMKLQP